MVATSTKTLDREFGSHVSMSLKTVDTVALTLLDHRGKSLEAKTSLPDRLIKDLGLGGSKVFGSPTKFRGKDGVNLFTLTKRP